MLTPENYKVFDFVCIVPLLIKDSKSLEEFKCEKRILNCRMIREAHPSIWRLPKYYHFSQHIRKCEGTALVKAGFRGSLGFCLHCSLTLSFLTLSLFHETEGGLSSLLMPLAALAAAFPSHRVGLFFGGKFRVFLFCFSR